MNIRDKTSDLKSINISKIITKKGELMSFGYKNKTNYITKNFTLDQAIREIQSLLENDFLQAVLFTLQMDYHLTRSKNGEDKITTKKASIQEKPDQNHNRTKNRLVSAEGKKYLYELGITTIDGEVKKNKNDKYKQINQYVELFDGFLKKISFDENIKLVDMGSGKGYLTFAIYDYLVNKLNLKPTVIGVEMRPELVKQCNGIAKNSELSGLQFEEGNILDYELEKTDILVALHACNTATDDAIYKGIKAESKVIVCAPCCHKQIRNELKPTNELKLISKHGILKERQAEILTDSIRALILEYNGYSTKVFEFISTEHTPKNVLIVGILKKNFKKKDPKILDSIKGLKKLFGVKEHYLESLMA